MHVTQAKQKMVAARADVNRWSASHQLKLNPDKSEVIWLGTRQQLAKLSPADKTLQLYDSTLTASTTLEYSLTVSYILTIRRDAV